jgi:radical SAM superfamily enzyme YgiQ (UPF0313 family)
MRVLLVNPYYPVSETPSPPLGLAFLGAALEAAGIEVQVLDCVVLPYSRSLLEDTLNSFVPDVVGVTAVTMNVHEALKVLNDVKALDPKVITVMGGPHVSFCAERTLKEYPELDLVVVGEGEATLVELVQALAAGRDWHGLRGLAYRDGDAVAVTGRRGYADVNALPPPARHLLPLGRYRALGMPVSMTTSRGCPFKCIFCVGRKMVGSRVRYRDPRRVVDEMAALSSLGFEQINLADDLFTANRNHCLAICSAICERALDVRWTAFARVDTVTRPLLERMRRAGCRAVSFGVESGNETILRRVRKGITTAQVLRAAEMCLATGVTPYASFILGLPGETPGTLRETLDFSQRLQRMGVGFGFHVLAPFPGTEVREHCGRLDLRILSDDWRRYHANRAVVATATVTSAMLDAVVIDWERRYDEWLGDLGRRYAAGQASHEEAWPLIKLEHTVILYELMMGRALETFGRCGDGHGRAEPGQEIARLAVRLAETTEHTEAKIRAALQYAVAGDNLRCRSQNGRLRWEWVDYL